MSKRVCPWWLGYLLVSPLRRLFSDDPQRMLTPYIRPGMTVLEPGPGMGFFTLELARMVGPSGRVIAVDVQERMLRTLKRRAAKAGLLERIDCRLTPPDSLSLSDVAGQVDFTLAFAVIHEMPATDLFFAQAATASKIGAQLLLAEPTGHVTAKAFEEELEAASAAGFAVVQHPAVRRSHAALLRRGH